MTQKNPRVLITGGGRRIGAALVRRCAKLNFAVTIHVNQSLDDAQKLKDSLPNRELHQISCCDFSDPDARLKWLDTLGEFDLIINNASCYRLTPPGASETPENRQRYWQVNYLAALEIIAHQMKISQKSNHTGVIINMLDSDILTSCGAIKEPAEPAPGVDSYLYSRIMLAAVLQAMAAEAAPALRINSIAPGPVLPPVDCKNGGMQKILERVPMKQPVKVEEIANAVEFLWRNPSLNGVILPVDGGMHLNG